MTTEIQTIAVRAAPGLHVPVEGKPQTYITDAETISVPVTAYNLRRIADGDLVQPPSSPTKSRK